MHIAHAQDLRTTSIRHWFSPFCTWIQTSLVTIEPTVAKQNITRLTNARRWSSILDSRIRFHSIWCTFLSTSILRIQQKCTLCFSNDKPVATWSRGAGRARVSLPSAQVRARRAPPSDGPCAPSQPLSPERHVRPRELHQFVNL